MPEPTPNKKAMEAAVGSSAFGATSCGATNPRMSRINRLSDYLEENRW
jgi:hypothetical protein